jgi:hypothetical protein
VGVPYSVAIETEGPAVSWYMYGHGGPRCQVVTCIDAATGALIWEYERGGYWLRSLYHGGGWSSYTTDFAVDAERETFVSVDGWAQHSYYPPPTNPGSNHLWVGFNVMRISDGCELAWGIAEDSDFSIAGLVGPTYEYVGNTAIASASDGLHIVCLLPWRTFGGSGRESQRLACAVVPVPAYDPGEPWLNPPQVNNLGILNVTAEAVLLDAEWINEVWDAGYPVDGWGPMRVVKNLGGWLAYWSFWPTSGTNPPFLNPMTEWYTHWAVIALNDDFTLRRGPDVLAVPADDPVPLRKAVTGFTAAYPTDRKGYFGARAWGRDDGAIYSWDPDTGETAKIVDGYIYPMTAPGGLAFLGGTNYAAGEGFAMRPWALYDLKTGAPA